MADDVGRVTRHGSVTTQPDVTAPAPRTPTARPAQDTVGRVASEPVGAHRALQRGLTPRPAVLAPGPVNPTRASAPSFPFNYTVDEVLGDPARARAFVEDYFTHEAPFFAIARDRRTGLAFDGVDLDPRTREPTTPRRLTAVSKECLDVALLTKVLERHPLALRLMPQNAEAETLEILTRKIESYERFAREYPGYGGFMPWISINADGAVTPASDYWQKHVPALDNGEWAFVLLGAEHVLRENGHAALADRYKAFNDQLARNVRRVFYDERASSVRDQTRIANNRDANSARTSYPYGFIRGPHGVHEGAMMLHYMSLYAQPRLSRAQLNKLWGETSMERVENRDGTTWQAFWGSAHEEWEFAIMPKRDLPENRDLFRIRQEIRTQDAVRRGKPGFGASINSPSAGRQNEAGPPYAVNHGIPSIARENVEDFPFYALYGSFPVLLQQSDGNSGREGVAWLLNTLRARDAVTSIGGGESVSNDGSKSAPLKTVDGSFLNLLALTGGFENEMRARLKADRTYEGYIRAQRREYVEAFGSKTLREPSPMAAPAVAVPLTSGPS